MPTRLLSRAMQRLRQPAPRKPNVGTPERWISMVFGGAAIAAAIRQRGLFGGLLAVLGGYLLWRGGSGRCLLYSRLRVTTARSNDSGLWGHNLIHVRTRMTVQQPRETVYRRWRDLESLPATMRHIRSIRVDGNRSHWLARLPLGLQLRWESQIIQDSPGERLVWQSVADSQVDSRGEVRFRPTTGGGTEVEVDMYYQLPGTALRGAVTRLLGGLSEQMIRHDLERFKEAIGPSALDNLDQGLGREPVTPAHG